MSKRSCCGHSFMWFIFNLHRICPRLRCSICNSRLSSSFLPFAPLRPECLYVICAHQWPQERGVSTPSTAHTMAQLGGGTLIHWAGSCSTEGLSFTNYSFCHLACAVLYSQREQMFCKRRKRKLQRLSQAPVCSRQKQKIALLLQTHQFSSRQNYLHFSGGENHWKCSVASVSSVWAETEEKSLLFLSPSTCPQIILPWCTGEDSAMNGAE